MESILGYMTVRIKEGMFDGLEDEIIAYKKKYPKNIFLNYKLQDLYFETQEWKKLIKISKDTVSKLNLDKRAGAAAYIQSYYYLAYAEFKQEKIKKSLEYLDKGASYKDLIEGCYNDKENLKKIKQLRREISRD